MEIPKGLIVILHHGIDSITIEECLAALPKEWQQINREVREVKYSERIELAKLYDLNYGQFALEHRRYFNNEITGLLAKYPNYKIVYFGMAPIPLAIDFGQLFHNLRDIEIYQKHHVTKQWYQDFQLEGEDANEIETIGLPDKEQKGITEALIRLGVSHSVNQDDTFDLLPNAAEIDIHFQRPGEDVISSKAKMIEIGEAVKQSFDGLANNRSDIKLIHLFASIPCGVAFLIGTKISPNIHPFVQSYQYARTQEPKYKKAILVKGQINPERRITEEDKKLARENRELANKELTEGIKIYCGFNEDMSTNRNWYQGILPKADKSIMNEGFWTDLTALYQTSLKNDKVDFEKTTINDGFYWKKNEWFIDDNFFISVIKRLKDENEFKMAIRLFLFHEALHYSKHKLTELTAVGIGSFPKVLETADYQADVYGIINEYGYHSKMMGTITNPKDFFLNAIRIATETMWSFDDNGVELEEIQIRRLNRYMIWYWLYARIEKDGNSLDDVVRLLEEKPVIELNGLKTKEENNRFYFILEKKSTQHLELAVFSNNVIIRDGSASNLPIENLLDGVKQMNGEMILDVMRSFVNR